MLVEIVQEIPENHSAKTIEAPAAGSRPLLVYDGDFKPYLNDIATQAGLWLDKIAPGVLEGYPGSISDPRAAEWVVNLMHPAEFFYVGSPDVTVRDVKKMQRLSNAVRDFLDAAS